MLTYVVNLAYMLTLYAFIARDMLLLRSMLVAAQIVFVMYGVSFHVRPMAIWNTVFLTINAAWVIHILLDRRALVLPPEVQALYDRHFTTMPPREFRYWWGLGRRGTLTDVALVRNGAMFEALYFLLAGSVQIARQGVHVTTLSAGFFVGEMSLVTGQPANADAYAIGDVEVMRWDMKALGQLRTRNPGLWAHLQSVIGRDLVEKLKRGAPISTGQPGAPDGPTLSALRPVPAVGTDHRPSAEFLGP